MHYRCFRNIKVFATQNKQFVDKITQTTNSQNAISSRDLSSNDQMQRDLDDLFKSRGYYYERKPGQFNDLAKNERRKILSNEKVGQSLLAVVKHLPAIAMAQRSKLWTDFYYEDVFGSRVDELLVSYLIYAYCLDRSKSLRNPVEGIDEEILKYGNFHLARVIGGMRVVDDWRQCPTQMLAELIKDIEQNPKSLARDYEKAPVKMRQDVEELSEKDTTKIINVFKSDKIQQKLDSLMNNVTQTLTCLISLTPPPNQDI